MLDVLEQQDLKSKTLEKKEKELEEKMKKENKINDFMIGEMKRLGKEWDERRIRDRSIEIDMKAVGDRFAQIKKESEDIKR